MIAEARAQYLAHHHRQSRPGAAHDRSGNLHNSSQANTGQTSTLWSAPIDVSWTPDFWGKIRNEVHEAQYAAQVSAADLELEKLTEQASLAEYYFEIRGQDMLQTDPERDRGGRSEIARLRPGRSTTPASAITSPSPKPRPRCKSAQASAINVGLSRAQYEHAIAMLLGKIASDFSIPVKPMVYAPPRDSHRRALATCRTPA